MARKRYNNLTGTLAASFSSGLTTGTLFATAPTYNDGTALPALTGSDYIPLVLDPGTSIAEVVYLTTYAGGGALTGTITRAQEGTGASAHNGGVYICGPTVLDWTAGGDATGTLDALVLGGTANVESIVRANTVTQLAAPTTALSMNTQRITSLAPGIALTDAPNLSQLPALATLINTIATTTVASGSNGGTISAIESWATPSAGVLSVAAVPVAPVGTAYATVAASGSTTAIISYTGISGSTLTGCAYISGSPSGTVSTGGTVTFGWVPPVTGTYLVRSIGGGGAGGSGGTPTSAITQSGAGGGAQGGCTEKLCSLTAGTFYPHVAGAGGTTGGTTTSNGHAGAFGGSGGATTFGTSLVAAVGGGGGGGSGASSTGYANYTFGQQAGTANPAGGVPGGFGAVLATTVAPGVGGSVLNYGGAPLGTAAGPPLGFGPAGGQAGQTATATIGGAGGQSGSYANTNNGNTSVTAAGAAGASGSDYGAGGGGGGGGATSSGAGGAGGAGAQGATYIIGPLV